MQERASVFRVEWRDNLPQIRTERLLLRLPSEVEVPKIVSFLRRNRDHTRRWEPAHGPSFFSEETWRGIPTQQCSEARQAIGFRFRALWLDDPTDFIAHGVLRDIARGDLQFCTLGYTVDHLHTGKGVATEMGEALVRFAFEILDLHRIEACYMPANLASARVLTKLGFEKEGLLRQSLKVNGAWEDHVLVSRLNPDWRGGRPLLGR